jgi:hypothetical protein
METGNYIKPVFGERTHVDLKVSMYRRKIRIYGIMPYIRDIPFFSINNLCFE